jgi:hypothetical protein
MFYDFSENYQKIVEETYYKAKKNGKEEKKKLIVN